MKFVKMHGCGNDYVYLDAVRDAVVAARVGRAEWVRLVQRMSDRHKGIGSDGVIAVCRPTSKRAHVRMRMFNADGSESEMCGNGVRCVAKFAHDRLGIESDTINVQTGSGVLPIEVHTRRGVVVGATVDMGEPHEGLKASFVRERGLSWKGKRANWGVEAGDVCVCGVFVSMGNPHLVVFEPLGDARNQTMTPRQVGEVPLATVGPLLESHPAFAKRMNIHFAGVVGARGGVGKRIVMRTWERGSGITQACGTGACAVVVAGVLTARTGREVDVDLPGGRLAIRWDRVTNHVFMTGEAVDVFEGEWPDR